MDIEKCEGDGQVKIPKAARQVYASMKMENHDRGGQSRENREFCTAGDLTPRVVRDDTSHKRKNDGRDDSVKPRKIQRRVGATAGAA